jgi:hypothetical protein
MPCSFSSLRYRSASAKSTFTLSVSAWFDPISYGSRDSLGAPRTPSTSQPCNLAWQREEPRP